MNQPPSSGPPCSTQPQRVEAVRVRVAGRQREADVLPREQCAGGRQRLRHQDEPVGRQPRSGHPAHLRVGRPAGPATGPVWPPRRHELRSPPWSAASSTGRACGCTSSPARAAPARPRWPRPSRSRWPATAGGSCSSRSRAGRASPSSSTSRRCPTRSARSRSAPAAATCSRSPSTPRTALLEYLEMFYKLGRAGRALTQDRRHRLRHHDRPGPARRAAHRQGLRGRAPPAGGAARPVYDAVVLDAPPTGRITRFLNVNTEVAGLAKVGPIRGQADSIMALLTLAADRRAPRHPARGDAGAGDRATASPSCTAAGLPVGGGRRQHGARGRCCEQADLTAAASGRLDPRRGRRRPRGGRGRRRATALVDGLLDRGRASTPRGWRWRSAERRTPARRWAARPTSCRCCPTASTSAALYAAGRAALRDQGAA